MRTQSARALRNNRDFDSFDDYDSRLHHLRKADRRDRIEASPIAIELYIYRDFRPADRYRSVCRDVRCHRC